jgi:AcrR family transcriptional regulator
MSRSGSHTRQEILLAANRIVLEQGVEHLTLQATAQEAGVSKGGLLHHFPTKEALIVGMIQLYLDRFSRDFNACAEADEGDTPGRWTRSYLEVTFSDNERIPRLNSGLLAAVATNPELLLPVQNSFAEWVKLLGKDGVDPVTATIVRLVADGLWLVELFGLAAPDKKMKDKVLRQVEEMVDAQINSK